MDPDEQDRLIGRLALFYVVFCSCAGFGPLIVWLLLEILR